MNLSIALQVANQEVARKSKTTFQGMLPEQDGAILPVGLGISKVDINESKTHFNGDTRINADHALAGLAIVSAELEKSRHGTTV